MGFGYGFGGGFPVMFSLVFGLVIIIFVIGIVKAVAEWHSNNQQPRLTVDAVLVAKRADTSVHHHANAGDLTGAHGFSTTTSTTYYATFQVESGERMEFTVSGREYGELAEGDIGRLSFQGTRYLGFLRDE